MNAHKLMLAEYNAQARAKGKKVIGGNRPQIASRPPQDPINVARLKLWRERVREVGIHRHRMEAGVAK